MKNRYLCCFSGLSFFSTSVGLSYLDFPPFYGQFSNTGIFTVKCSKAKRRGNGKTKPLLQTKDEMKFFPNGRGKNSVKINQNTVKKSIMNKPQQSAFLFIEKHTVPNLQFFFQKFNFRKNFHSIKI